MFQIALSNVLMTLLYIVPGYVLCKLKKVNPDHLQSLSSILVYICGTTMIASSFFKMNRDFISLLGEMATFSLITGILQITFILICFLIFRKKFGEQKYRILAVGSVLGNVGFFGIPIIRALLPDVPHAVCYSVFFSLSMNIIVFTIGVFCVTGNKKFVSLKTALINPTTVSFAIALPIFLLGISDRLPQPLLNGINLVGDMSTPLCMFIMGIRLATVELKKLFTNGFAYIITFCKLIVFPLFSYAAVYFLPMSDPFKISVLVLSAAPCATYILALGEMHESDTTLPANCILLSTLLCFITIPILTLLV